MIAIKFAALKETLYKYYRENCNNFTTDFQKLVYEKMNAFDAANPGLNQYRLKSELYGCIAENSEPKFFTELPFYCEMGTIASFGDGCFTRGALHANGWLHQRNNHFIYDENPHACDVSGKNRREQLYLVGGIDIEHFGIPDEKLFSIGLKGVFDECVKALVECKTDEERDFVSCAISGLKAIKTMQDKFALAAAERLKIEPSKELERIADAASRVPWEAPKTTYEGLCTLAFMRKSVGSLEGVGFNSFGRVDLILEPLYKADIANGVSDSEIYDDIFRFMLLWDCHVDRSAIMTGYADYEYENSLVLGGCDKNGNEVFNRITSMFIEAQLEIDGLAPKLMCRFSSESSEEYLSLINSPTLKNKSILLYENDDVIIPAQVKAGIALEDARGYLVSGCWDIALPDITKRSCGEYLSIIKVLDWTLNQPKDKLIENELNFAPFDKAESFDEVYSILLDNIIELIGKKAEFSAIAARVWSKVNPVCIYSALTRCCLKNRRDYTNGGTGYPIESFYLTGFTDVIDSLLAIKRLCFDEKLVSVERLIEACRNNWSDEKLRAEALRSPHHGDGKPESAALAHRLLDDIYNRTRELPTAFGGQHIIGIIMYTELIWWGKNIGATPNGRKSGEYISHGLTPSRLHRIESVTDVIRSMSGIDLTKCADNSILNVVLPATKMPPEALNAFLRASAKAGVEALQINVVNREELLAAQRDPERYRHIVVRVCGFSAPFVALSPEWQEEFLSRNFYE